MTPHTERRLLEQLLRKQQALPTASSRVPRLIILWCVLVLALMALLQTAPESDAMWWGAASLATGVVIGVVMCFEASRSQWPTLFRPYLDSER